MAPIARTIGIANHFLFIIDLQIKNSLLIKKRIRHTILHLLIMQQSWSSYLKQSPCHEESFEISGGRVRETGSSYDFETMGVAA